MDEYRERALVLADEVEVKDQTVWGLEAILDFFLSIRSY